jgi:hypothetical protein
MPVELLVGPQARYLTAVEIRQSAAGLTDLIREVDCELVVVGVVESFRG